MSKILNTVKIRNSATDASPCETNRSYDERDSRTQEGGFIPKQDSFEYKVEKGKALIISINYFGRKNERKGNIHDRERFESLCKKMGFKTKLLEDSKDPIKNTTTGLSKEKIEDEIKDWSSNKNDVLKDTDCFILAIFAHGGIDPKTNNEYIQATDLGNIELQWIFKMFANNICTALVDKPKIFILQHCRGSKNDYGINVNRPMTAQSDGIPIPEETQEVQIANMSQFIIFQACFEGFKAYLTEKGSAFIQLLADEFEEGLPNGKELHQMMLKINRRVANYCFITEEELEGITEFVGYSKEASCFKSTSTRDIYLPWNKDKATNNN